MAINASLNTNARTRTQRGLADSGVPESGHLSLSLIYKIHIITGSSSKKIKKINAMKICDAVSDDDVGPTVALCDYTSHDYSIITSICAIKYTYKNRFFY